MRFGKKNIVSTDITNYNVGIVGESGVGKTTLMKDVCQRLTGDDGYILLDIGKEEGTKAIAGVVYEKVDTIEHQFDPITGERKEEYKHNDGIGYLDLVDSIVANKDEYYPNLKVLVIDTIDELFSIGEPYMVKRYNEEQRKRSIKTGERLRTDYTSINEVYGGYMRGQDTLSAFFLNQIERLKKVGVSTWIVGHTKLRTKADKITGEEYDILTNNLQDRYFNEFRSKLHILGTITINRDIETITKKGFGNKIEKEGRIVGEKRIITFRDDSYGIDSKSRFNHIESSIEYDADLFIKAIEDAIKAEQEIEESTIDNVEEVRETRELERKANLEHAKEMSSKKLNNETEELEREQLEESLKSGMMNADPDDYDLILEEMGELGVSSIKDLSTSDIEKLIGLLE